MSAAAAAQEFEQAAVERNRLAAVRSLLERQRVASAAVGTLDAIAVALAGTDANAQVFQVRDGVLSDRQSFYLANEARAPAGGGDRGVPAAVLRARGGGAGAGRRRGAGRRDRRRGAQRAARRARRGARRRARREAADPRARGAQRGARARGGAAQGGAPARAPRRGARRPARARSRCRRCRCASSASTSRTSQGTHTVASMVVFEAGVPKRSDYRRFRIRTRQRLRRLRLDGGGARAADGGVGAPVGHLAARVGLRPQLRGAAEPDRDRRRQGPALGGPRAARGGARPGRRGDLARQAPRGGLRPGPRRRRSCSPTRARSCSCSRASATRRTASRSPITARGATAR